MYNPDFILSNKTIRVYLHFVCIILKIKKHKYSDISFDIKGILRELKITFTERGSHELLKRF